MNKIISLRKECVLFSATFKKIIQEVGGVTQPSILCRWPRNCSWYRFNTTKLLISAPKNFTFCLPLFSIEMKQNFNS